MAHSRAERQDLPCTDELTILIAFLPYAACRIQNVQNNPTKSDHDWQLVTGITPTRPNKSHWSR